MDTSRPGFVRADNPLLEVPATSPPIIGLEGALKSPFSVSTVFPNPPAARDFQVELQKLVNLAATQAADPLQDPIITVPLYGGRHAKKNASDVVTLDIDSSSWVNDLNRDPRTRVAAGFGTRVMQKHQEKYVREAWRQVERILDANRRIRAAVFNMLVATCTASDVRQDEGRAAPGAQQACCRGHGSPTTLYHQLREPPPSAVVSGVPPPRQAQRQLARKLGVSTPDYSPDAGLNDGSHGRAAKQLPAGAEHEDHRRLLSEAAGLARVADRARAPTPIVLLVVFAVRPSSPARSSSVSSLGSSRHTSTPSHKGDDEATAELLLDRRSSSRRS